jgi:hypothetical protein
LSEIEQHNFIKFCVKLGKSATENFEMLREPFRERSLSRTAVFEWHSRFKASRDSAEDDDISGRPCAPAKRQKMLKISRTYQRRPSPNNQ